MRESRTRWQVFAWCSPSPTRPTKSAALISRTRVFCKAGRAAIAARHCSGRAWTPSQLVTITVIVLGALRILAGALAVPDMLVLLLCVGVLTDPVKRLDNFIRLWQEGYTGFT